MLRLGTHFLLEMAGCDGTLLDDAERVSAAMLEAARKANTTILGSSFHKFSPQGVSGVVVIAESHLSIHTWPELGYAAVDVFTCGDRAMPERACKFLIELFRPTEHQIKRLDRGIPGKLPVEMAGAEGVVWQPPRQGAA
ncbi:MAG: adenosylmethionine decarboxylase [Deltaproteobacteria bacterium]|nr:MAG: adenosylmethionine decarboxylase [Deltaproteobacteria bacterium]